LLIYIFTYDRYNNSIWYREIPWPFEIRWNSRAVDHILLYGVD